MYPTSHPWVAGEALGGHLEPCGVSRRDFLTPEAVGESAPEYRWVFLGRWPLRLTHIVTQLDDWGRSALACADAARS